METNDKKWVVLNDIPGICVVHPGEHLREELKERKIKQKDFANEIGMETSHLSALIHGKRNITPAIATRLEQALGISARLWMDLQTQYNLDKAYMDLKESEALHTSQLVYGYDKPLPETAPAMALGEPDLFEYGSRKRVTVHLPVRDLKVLHALADRLGWMLTE